MKWATYSTAVRSRQMKTRWLLTAEQRHRLTRRSTGPIRPVQESRRSPRPTSSKRPWHSTAWTTWKDSLGDKNTATAKSNCLVAGRNSKHWTHIHPQTMDTNMKPIPTNHLLSWRQKLILDSLFRKQRCSPAYKVKGSSVRSLWYFSQSACDNL